MAMLLYLDLIDEPSYCRLQLDSSGVYVTINVAIPSYLYVSVYASGVSMRGSSRDVLTHGAPLTAQLSFMAWLKAQFI